MLILIILLASLITLDASEQVFFTLASKRENKKIAFILTAVIIHLSALAIWLWILRLAPMGIVLPVMSINYIAVGLAGKLVFKEEINLKRWAAIVIITIGTALVWSGK
jgi:undecaprenyl phosphate-alpha-L-ara4N flippase subunit ArnE